MEQGKTAGPRGRTLGRSVTLGRSLSLAVCGLPACDIGVLVWLVAPHVIVRMAERGNVYRGNFKKC